MLTKSFPFFSGQVVYQPFIETVFKYKGRYLIEIYAYFSLWLTNISLILLYSVKTCLLWKLESIHINILPFLLCYNAPLIHVILHCNSIETSLDCYPDFILMCMVVVCFRRKNMLKCINLPLKRTLPRSSW